MGLLIYRDLRLGRRAYGDAPGPRIEKNMKTHEVDVVVVGAGLAGLAAAQNLTDAGLTVMVLEARDRVGGRLLNHQLAGGGIVEVGGQWVGPTQLRVNAWIKELDLELFDTYDDGFNQFEYRGRLSRYRGTIPKVNPVVLADIAQAQARLDRMAKRVPLDEPWRAEKADEWDAQTVATWLSRHTHTGGARAFFQLLCEGVWAAEPADLSLLHFLFYINSGGGIDTLISTDGGGQQHRIIGGSQLIAQRAAERLGDRVVLNSPVQQDRRRRRIDGRLRRRRQGSRSPRHRRAPADPRRATRLRARPAGVARPAHPASAPGLGDQVHGRLRRTVLARRRLLRTGHQHRRTGQGRLRQHTLFRWSWRPGWVSRRRTGARPGTHACRAATRCRHRLLRPLLGPRAGKPIEYVERSWAEEIYSRGCYAGYFPPGTWTSLGFALRSACGRIPWAGTETAEVWNGYMDGAISSGERAARDVLAANAQ